ncbi:MAG TPA: hypothetical protein VIL86_19965 [Tepidisphaeraceae bacterium]|jgi:uncharacterized membrane protein
MDSPLLIILSRYLHVITACVAVGCVFFMRILLPLGLKALPPDSRQEVFLRCRRGLKTVLHTAILLFLISGAFNYLRLRGQYKLDSSLLHPLIWTHITLALVVFALALYVLTGKQPPANHARWTAINLALLFILIAVASTTKHFREQAARSPVPSPQDMRTP